ncbi:uncharacterized protein LOC121729812 [Aricia agestis]|uniref:uncharacterized protein LOC121729812 n=1 Tax=Aricia agestis TaxID=91739 RepID=UPI001C208671|nr:uncharacterized protein LOC121729812 [Aricia agestis]XP_041974377.1 uncharacterized protein LOC121729812 [Aricia agestis]
MWRNVLYSCAVYYFFVLVLTAPANSYSRGPQYIVNAPKHPYIEVKNSTYHGAGPREEARAMCSVRTQEVNATANATITRRLHGVVTSRELHNAIQRLEVVIYGQMQQLWQSLDALRTHMSTQRASRASYPDRRSVSFRYVPNK